MVQPVTKDGSETPGIKEQVQNLDLLIHVRFGEADLEAIPVQLRDEYEALNSMEPAACKPDIDIIGDEAYDTTDPVMLCT